MPWKTMDVREQRVSFVVTASRGEKSLTALCREFGISRPTGYLWLSRYRQEGLVGIGERSRRPGRSPDRTAAEVEEAVVALRQRYPDWGARKLKVLLRQRGIELARSTIHRILLRHGLVHEPEHPGLAPQRFERKAPNELWQMDFKGPLCPADRVGPLSVLDDHSRYLLVLQTVANTSAELVREHLQGAFGECGMPDGMLMDHGTPWWSAQSPRGFTKLSLWLMKQGIALHWGRIRHPQTQGKVERFHGELQRALQYRPPRADLQSWLDEFRWEHNHVRPHEALGMQTPVSHWRRSERIYDPNPRAWEYPAGSWVLKVDSDGKIKLKAEHWLISRALSGERIQLVTMEHRVLVYYCRSLVRELNLGNQRSTIVDRWLPDESSQTKL
jgi:transposase InsO family protein